MKSEMKVDAGDVQKGDMIPGLGNAYVFDVEENPDFRDGDNIGLARDKVCITFHDAEGEENYLLIQPHVPITVKR